MNNTSGSFTVSLDFELYWGVRDKRSIEAYKQNLLGVWEVVPQILTLFQNYDIHATWATVGFLFLKDQKEFKESLPELLPQYKQQKLCPYHYFNSLDQSSFSSEDFKKMHFAEELIEEIEKFPFQEIGTHTYSHYYTREANNMSLEAFEADINRTTEAGKKNNIKLNSLVFPRNQIDNECLYILQKSGIKSFRGNPMHWAYKDGEVEKTFLQRAYRFLDIYINLSGSHVTLPIKTKGITELKSSIFLRAFSQKFKLLEWLKIRRVKNAMTEAAKNGENFHLWWHPHNFGINQKENLANLEEILKHFQSLQDKYNMVSFNMQELGDYYG